MRYVFMASPLMVGGDTDASIIESGSDEMTKKVWLPFWNSVKFLTIYAELHDWEPDGKTTSDDVLDKWIVSRTNKFTAEFSDGIEDYNIPRAAKLIPSYVEDLSTWYVRRSRNRFSEGDKGAMETLYNVLHQANKTMAPVIPFLTEAVHQILNLDGEESVHLELWPEVGAVDEELLATMEQVRQVVTLGQSLRVENRLKVRQPLAELQVTGAKLSDDLKAIVMDELNVKMVSQMEALDDGTDWVGTEQAGMGVALNTHMTDELRVEGNFREVCRVIQDLRKKQQFDIKDRAIVNWDTDSDDMKKVFIEMGEELKEAVKADELTEGVSEDAVVKTVNGETVKFVLSK